MKSSYIESFKTLKDSLFSNLINKYSPNEIFDDDPISDVNSKRNFYRKTYMIFLKKFDLN